MLTLAVIVAILSIGIALDVRHHRQMVADKRFQEWLARGVHPSLRNRSISGS
jgi:hypothetical protein